MGAGRMRVAALLVLAMAGNGAVGTASAATYYVAPAPLGNDANPGTQAAPWRTLQKAGDVAGAGDDVVVLPGTYQGFRSRNAGTPAAPVRFLAQAGAVVNAPGPANSNGDNIWVRNVDYVVLDGFESRAAPRAGIAVQGEPDANATGVVIRNCFCHDNTRWGIFTGFARDLVIEDNETSFSAVEHGIYVSNSGDRPTVRRNTVHDNNASGIQLNADPLQQGDDPTDPQGDGIIEDALVEANVIYNNGAAGGAAINLASVRSSLIRNNLLYNNRASGIAGWDDGEGSNQYGTRDNRLLGNTVVQPSNGRFAVSLKNGSTGNAVVDNILIHTGTRGSLEVDASSQVGLVSDYNVVVNVFSDDVDFLTLAQWRALGFDLHSIVSSPAALFVNPAANDYRLAAGSPARDAGTPLADLPVDRLGTTRPQGAGVDIGAYEMGAAAPSPTPTFTIAPSATRTASRTATRTATATATPVAGSLQLAGAIRYYRGERAVAQVTVGLQGPKARTTETDAAGAYAFGALPSASWTVVPRKTGGGGLAVSALDAAYVLQYLAGLRTLDAAQRLAADVTGNGEVSALDATRILQFAVGSLPQFPAAAACGSDWLFLPAPAPAANQSVTAPVVAGTCQPGAIAFAPLVADAAGQDFRAVLLGDCTGNW